MEEEIVVLPKPPDNFKYIMVHKDYEYNKEKNKELCRKYKQENKDKVREQNKLYYEKNKDKINETARERYHEKKKSQKKSVNNCGQD